MAWRDHAAWAGVVVALLSSAFGWVWSANQRADEARATANQERFERLDRRLSNVEHRGEWFYRTIASQWQDNPAEFGE